VNEGCPSARVRISSVSDGLFICSLQFLNLQSQELHQDSMHQRRSCILGALVSGVLLGSLVILLAGLVVFTRLPRNVLLGDLATASPRCPSRIA
jgi:hypothetical protein